jgi:hypothetical protein
VGKVQAYQAAIVIRARLLARSEQPCPDDDGSDGSRDLLTGRCETILTGFS